MLGLYIPTARHGAIEIRQLHGLSDMQQAVKGLIETISLDNPSMEMIVNEEGMLQHLQVNRRATALLWAHNEDYAYRHYVHGNAILVGPINGRGDYTDAPAPIEKLIRSRLFAIEYAAQQYPRPRVAEGIDDIWDAYAAVIRLNKDYSGKFRVVAAA